MRVLVVFDHPRRDSFCGAVLDQFCEGLQAAGHQAEVADLRREGFDPRLPLVDEPDWNDSHKVYSAEVLTEQERVARNDALAFIFPVWWWSMPATLKGWIDRVFNNGWAYGERKLPHQAALLIGTASNSAEDFRKRGYDTAMKTQLALGIMGYCGIEKHELVLLHDVMSGEGQRKALLARARKLGFTYF
jgi:NAD(P)H dehydrogenase (quinone)